MGDSRVVKSNRPIHKLMEEINAHTNGTDVDPRAAKHRASGRCLCSDSRYCNCHMSEYEEAQGQGPGVLESTAKYIWDGVKNVGRTINPFGNSPSDGGTNQSYDSRYRRRLLSDEVRNLCNEDDLKQPDH